MTAYAKELDLDLGVEIRSPVSTTPVQRRALFTGSREWSDEAPVAAVIDSLPLDALVIHGKNPRGLDAMVDRLARARGLAVDAEEADWEQFGEKAGTKRNAALMKKRPTEGHAFPLPSSRGTWDMVKKLRLALVDVKVYGAYADVEAKALDAAVADERVAAFRSLDTETWRFMPGRMAPRIVCASTAEVVAGKIQGSLVWGLDRAVAVFEAMLRAGYPIALANAAYDLCVMAAAKPELVPPIFRALREGRIHDILIGESLNAIYYGHLGEMPDGRPLYNPATGEATKRYSLPLVVLLTLGRTDAKENARFKNSYALFDGITDTALLPEEARVYPVDDSRNTLEAGIVQIVGRPGDHYWDELPALPGRDPIRVCRSCGETWNGELARVASVCLKAPRREGHKNLGNMAAQVRADFALELGSCWSFRTDPERVERLAVETDIKHAVAVERFKKKKWVREDGSEDTVAVKRAIAEAYGAKVPCLRCAGTGKVPKIKIVECRGVKESGRYKQGCLGAACTICSGARRLYRNDGLRTCKNEFEGEALVEEGCDGTGYQLSLVPMLPRTATRGVGTDRGAKAESGDEDLADYGEDEFEKTRVTYIPWLRKGTRAPLPYSANVIVATGRCSYEGSPIHQMSRETGYWKQLPDGQYVYIPSVRECIRARGAWCGSPVEYVLGSTDYEAGELCTLAQFTYWLFGYSQMRDVINSTGKPGILHSDLAAEVIGVSLEEFLKRLKAKDKQAALFRQAMKPINFGTPGGMGIPKLVATNRKKNAGFTVCERGPARNSKGEPGYYGIRFCILTGGAKECGTTKIISWKGRECAPVCKACCETVEHMLRPAYFRRYPEVKDYFKWASKQIDLAKRAGNKIVMAPCAVWDAEAGQPRIVRERGIKIDDYSALCNNGFQAMLSDIGKDAYVNATEECYTGVKPDGSPSPLAGCRLPLYAHDEPVSELPRATAHLSGPRLAEIMVDSGKRLAPDVTWRAETAIAEYLSKSMEPVYDEKGDLMLWEPERRKAA